MEYKYVFWYIESQPLNISWFIDHIISFILCLQYKIMFSWLLLAYVMSRSKDFNNLSSSF